MYEASRSPRSSRSRIMKVSDVMSHPPYWCDREMTLEQAAGVMWDHDCGFVPVVDPSGNLVGTLTDRDACMAAYTKGQPLARIPVSEAMSHDPCWCRETDDLSSVHEVFRRQRIRRMPVNRG